MNHFCRSIALPAELSFASNTFLETLLRHFSKNIFYLLKAFAHMVGLIIFAVSRDLHLEEVSPGTKSHMYEVGKIDFAHYFGDVR